MMLRERRAWTNGASSGHVSSGHEQHETVSADGVHVSPADSRVGTQLAATLLY